MNGNNKIKYILFDAANTLIHKPALWGRLLGVLEQHGISIPQETLEYHHKLLSEVVVFPDKTSREFYKGFNNELLLSLGIVPSETLLDEIFTACTYLPWEKFDDTAWFAAAGVPLGVLSNFNSGLPELLNGLFGNIFSDIIVSESVSARKPEIRFYEHAVREIGLLPEEVLYVGDSIKLDVIPASQVGFNVRLIDRQGIFKASPYAVRSLTEITELLTN